MNTTGWIVFNGVILVLLALDLGVFNRKAHEVSVKETLAWASVWVSLSFMFNAGIWWWKGAAKATEFLTGYVIEMSLSVDNLFVFLMLFNYFAIPRKYQHKVLFWGILGALVLRAAMILAGTALVQRFSWSLYFFGAFLVYTGIQMAFGNDEEKDPGDNAIVRLSRRFIPLADGLRGDRFFVREGGRSLATPLFLSLVVISFMDIVFAVDSVPAIFAITTDPFIVYTSNICAIMGLRSLYFALAAMADMFHYLKYGLSIVLSIIGLKMLLVKWVHLPISVSLGLVIGILILSVAASKIWPKKEDQIQAH